MHMHMHMHMHCGSACMFQDSDVNRYLQENSRYIVNVLNGNFDESSDILKLSTLRREGREKSRATKTAFYHLTRSKESLK